MYMYTYGVATISRLLKIAGLFCRISSLLQGSCANETFNVKEPTHLSHPIVESYDDKTVFISVYKVDLFSYLSTYGVATISRLLKILGLFCRILSLL